MDNGTPAKIAVEGYFIDFLQTVIANLPRDITKKEARYLAENGQLVFNFFTDILKKAREDNVMNIIMRQGIVVDNHNILRNGRMFERNNGYYQIEIYLNSNATTGEKILPILLDSKNCRPTNLYEFLSGFFSSLFAANTSSGFYFVSTGAIDIDIYGSCLPFLYQERHDKSWHLDVRNTRYQWPKNTYFIFVRTS